MGFSAFAFVRLGDRVLWAVVAVCLEAPVIDTEAVAALRRRPPCFLS